MKLVGVKEFYNITRAKVISAVNCCIVVSLCATATFAVDSAIDRSAEAAKAAEAGAAEETEEETTEEVTTEEETTEVTTEEETTEATTEDDHLSGPLIDESSSPLDDENTTGPGGTSVTGDTSTSGPSSSGTGNGPGDVTVSPADERTNSNAVTSDTPGAIQAPDGSWVVPDDSTGPGQ